MLDSLTQHRSPTGVQSISRRSFLKGVAGALAGGALLVIGERVLGTTWVPQPLPMSLQRSTFARYVGGMFQVDSESSDVIALQLIRVESLPSNSHTEMRGSANADQEHCFSIMFRGRADQPLGQGTYHFEHEQIGGFPLFIVPRVPDQSGRYYEAIFNCPPI